MKINKNVIGLVLLNFGCGVVASVIFSGLGFFVGVLIIALGILELYC